MSGKPLEIVVRLKSSDPSASESTSKYRVRLVCEWLDVCALSDVFGEGALAWVSPPEPAPVAEGTEEASPTSSTPPGMMTASYRVESECGELVGKEKQQAFNASPGIYAILLDQEIITPPPPPQEAAEEGAEPEAAQQQQQKPDELRLVPVAFAYVDCSLFFVETGKITARGQSVKGVAMEIEITCSQLLVAHVDAMPLEPLLLDFGSLGGYPLLEDEAPEEAADSIYVYGKLELGGAISRMVFARPITSSYLPEDSFVSNNNNNNNNNNGGNEQAATLPIMPLNCRIVVLPGLADLARFKETLTSSTFILEVHREDLYQRAFHARNVDEYHRLLLEAAAAVGGGGGGAAAAAPPAKGAAAAPASAPMNTQALNQPSGPMSAADNFLLQSISRALQASSQIRPHGSGRFRLEQLLSSSVDLLREFLQRRRGIMEGDEDVVVREELMCEVRLAKPSKPLKWHRPDDISLKSALERELKEHQSKLDGTMAITGSLSMASLGTTSKGGTGSKKRKASSKPRHEQFEEKGTRLSINVELHRLLTHPKEPPRVMARISPNFSMTAPSSTMGLLGSRSGGALNATTGSSSSSSSSSGGGDDSMKEESDDEKMLRERLAATPFARMVFCFKYDDDETLLTINDAVQAVNLRALKDIQGSLRSYSFTDDELERCINGALDVITGFMVIDDDMRIVVLEGLAAPGKGMQSVFIDVPRKKENDNALKILSNPECLFPERLYGTFGPDLKRIRIRDKLKKLARRPELYNRKQVEEICFSAIDAVMSLRRAVDLRSTKELGMYPSAESLNKVELLYGEAVSRSDLDGTASEAQRAAQKKAKKREKEAIAAAEKAYEEQMALLATGGGINSNTSSSSSFGGMMKTGGETFESGAGGKSTRGKRSTQAPNTMMGESRCAPTDARNPAYEEYLKTRPLHRTNFLSEQKEALKAAYESVLMRTALRDKLARETLVQVLGEDAIKDGQPPPKIFLYSSQAENFKVKAFSELRARIGKFSDATYTFSKDFISQTICVVDEDADRKKIKAAAHSHWLTPSGFVYPKPKTMRDLIEHPKKPSDARIEDLKDAWQGDAPPPNRQGSTENLRLEKGYSVRVKGGNLFGSLMPVKFEKPFQLKLVGDRSKLPRGMLTEGTYDDKDPASFRSVHLGGEGQARIIQEAEEKEKADWASKVVVDDISFKVGGFTTRDKVLQFARTQDILKDAPTRKELIHLRNRKSHKGKDFSHAEMPLSILSSGIPYVPNAAANALARTSDPNKFITAREVSSPTQRPTDFMRFIDRNANAPRIMCVLSHREIAPLEAGEKYGAKWQGPTDIAPPVWTDAKGTGTLSSPRWAENRGKYGMRPSPRSPRVEKELARGKYGNTSPRGGVKYEEPAWGGGLSPRKNDS